MGGVTSYIQSVVKRHKVCRGGLSYRPSALDHDRSSTLSKFFLSLNLNQTIAVKSESKFYLLIAVLEDTDKLYCPAGEGNSTNNDNNFVERDGVDMQPKLPARIRSISIYVLCHEDELIQVRFG